MPISRQNAKGESQVEEASARPTLLIVEDDRRVGEYLFRFISPLGYSIDIAETFDSALTKVQRRPPDHALIDGRIPGGSGVALIKPFREANPNMRILLCTAYPSIANTVEAMRLGADGYLAKPVTPEQIVAAFGGEKVAGEEEAAGAADPESEKRGSGMYSLARARWEYINMVLQNCDGNVAATARHLGIHRQSLQRMLKKMPPTS